MKVVRGSTTTVYLEGLWEEVAGGAAKAYYSFNGQVVALRDRSSNAVTYLHGDHLGSVSVATSSSGVGTVQEYTPFGSHRGTGDITQTSLDYTAQRLDGTGLLYYHARMYDPALGRFVSPDSVVPGSASGGLDGIALKPLTADFHEPGFVTALNAENQYAFWFEMSDEEQQKVGRPWGPDDPQALNRYSYVQNNPLRYTDPTGHIPPCKEADCRSRINISGLPDPLKKAVTIGCWVLGCEVKDDVLIGQSPADGVSSMTPMGTISGGFKHAWIKRDLFRELKPLVGEADFKKFVAALQKGVVGPYGQSGIKVLKEAVNGYTHELKIGGSAQRLLGKINEYGVLVFDRFIRGGLH